MKINDYAMLDAVGLAEAVSSGEHSQQEVVEVAIEAVELLNPMVNAVVFKDYDGGRAVAAEGRAGPFAGVPMLIKDLGLEVKGWPRSSGSRFGGGVVDDFDCGLVKRYRDAGLIPLGRSTSSEFGIIGTTETAAHGATRNPWNLRHIAGGSSGGAAAAVASGMVPIAHASDGGFG